MHPKTREFIRKLAELCEQYEAELFYTKDDNGLHVRTPNDRDIAIGFYAADMRDVIAPGAKAVSTPSNPVALELSREMIDYLVARKLGHFDGIRFHGNAKFAPYMRRIMRAELDRTLTADGPTAKRKEVGQTNND